MGKKGKGAKKEDKPKKEVASSKDKLKEAREHRRGIPHRQIEQCSCFFVGGWLTGFEARCVS